MAGHLVATSAFPNIISAAFFLLTVFRDINDVEQRGMGQEQGTAWHGIDQHDEHCSCMVYKT